MVKEFFELPDEALDEREKFIKEHKGDLDLIHSKIMSPSMPEKYYLVLDAVAYGRGVEDLYLKLKKEGVELVRDEDNMPDFNQIEEEAMEYLSKETGFDVDQLKKYFPYLLY